MKIDLHMHTDKSDGDHSLEEVIGYARSARCSWIAITDHDTIDAWKKEELDRIGLPKDQRLNGYFVFGKEPDRLYVIQGEEITSKYDDFEVHILAYFLNESTVAESGISEHNSRMEIANNKRGTWVYEQLAGIVGHEMESGQETKKRMFSYSTFTRMLLQQHPAVVRALLGKESPSFEEALAFVKSPKSGLYRPIEDFYPEKEMPSMEEIVRMVVSAKAVPVLAHPNIYDSRFMRCAAGFNPEKFIEDFLNASNRIGGIEIYNKYYLPDSGRKGLCIWEKIAEEKNLLTTAGTDFHFKKTADGVSVTDVFVTRLVLQRKPIM